MAYFILDSITTYPPYPTAVDPSCRLAPPPRVENRLEPAIAVRDWILSRSVAHVATFDQGILHRVGSPVIAKQVITGGSWSPIQEPLESVHHFSTRSVGYRRRVRLGEIILNPREKSSLRVEDVVRVPPSATGWAHTNVSVGLRESERREVIPCQDYPDYKYAFTSFYPGWKFLNVHMTPTGVQPVSGNGSSVIATYRVYNNTPVSSFFKDFHITQDIVDNMRRGMVHQILGNSPMDDALITKVVGNAYSGVYDILTDLAEMPETIRTVATQIERISALYDLTRGKTSSAERRLKRLRARYNREYSSPVKREKVLAKRRREIYDISKEISSLWLEFRYGIMPMVYSIRDATKWLQTTDYEYFKYRETKVQKTTVNAFGYVTEVDVIHRAFAKVRINSKVAGLKLNPYTTALEKVRLSLLLNWVCNVGDLLSASYEPNGLVEQKFSYSRQVTERVLSMPNVGGEISPVVVFGMYHLDVIDPKKHLVFKFQNNMSLKRLVDAFALSWGATRWRFV